MSVEDNQNDKKSEVGIKESLDANRRSILWRISAFIRRNHGHFPHWLTAIFTLGLMLFAYKAWDESTRTTAALEGQLKILQEEQRPYVSQIDLAPRAVFRLLTVFLGRCR